jgi:parallel beta-helix repeat protein
MVTSGKVLVLSMLFAAAAAGFAAADGAQPNAVAVAVAVEMASGNTISANAAPAGSSATNAAPAPDAPAANAPPASAPEPGPAPRTLYVDDHGMDGAAGSQSAPIRTIAEAVELARPGDTVLVRDGIYNTPLRITKGGSMVAPLVIAAEHPGGAIIDGATTPPGTDLVVIGASHVTFRGFSVRNATRSGVSVWAVTDVTIDDNFVTGSHRAGIWIGAAGPGPSQGNRIIGNTVVGNCLENSARNWPSGWPRAIAVDLSTGVLVSGNVVWQNYGEGIGLLSTQSSTVAGNIVFDNFSVGIYLDNAPHSNVTGNLVFSTGDSRYYRSGAPAAGIVIANEVVPYPMPSDSISVTGNRLINAGEVHYMWFKPDAQLTNSIIAPNISQPTITWSKFARIAGSMTAIPVVSWLRCGPVLHC